MTEPNTTELIVNKVDAAVTTLSSKLGVATDHFYPILVKQQVISGYVDLGAALLMLIATGLMAYTVWWMHTSSTADEDYVGWPYFFGFVCLITTISLAYTGLLSILNPEYYALQEITAFVK